MIETQHILHPEQIDRVETGPVKFGDDWTGVFIRGDNAVYFAHILDQVLANPEMLKDNALIVAVINSLSVTLKSCEEKSV